MNAPTDETSTGFSPVKIGGFVLCGILLLLLLPTLRAPSSNTPKNGATEADDVSRSQCERSLISALDGLQPVRLGISSERRVMIDTLNNWLDQCADPTAADAEGADEALRKELLTATGFEQSQSPRFQLRDAEHIRNSLLAAAIVGRVVADLRTDQERALALFYYVVRTLDLIPDDSPQPALTPYESLVYGVGSAEDRAWTYALLMRQLRLDVVRIQPGEDVKDPYWLVGAVIPGEGVLMLDPRTGLPILVESDVQSPDGVLPSQAATLAQIREDDALLRRFDQESKPYPLTAADLANVKVLAIGSSSALAPRMGRLQAQLPQAIELYDGLASNSQRENGLIDRLVEAGNDGLWTAEQIRVWSYPEEQWAIEELSEEQKAWIAEREAVLDGPYAIAVTVNSDEEGNLIVGSEVNKPQNNLRRTRIAQLLGDFEAAQQGYLQVRINQVNLRQVQQYLKLAQETLIEQDATPQQMQQTLNALQQHLGQEVNRIMQTLPELSLNAAGADVATYWAAQLQYEQQDYRLAAESALAYVERIRGRFVRPAISLASLSLARDDRPGEAVKLSEKRPLQAALSPGDEVLIARWKAMSTAPASEEPQDTPPAANSKPESSEKPANDKPQPPSPAEPPEPEKPAVEEPEPLDEGNDNEPAL